MNYTGHGGTATVDLKSDVRSEDVAQHNQNLLTMHEALGLILRNEEKNTFKIIINFSNDNYH